MTAIEEMPASRDRRLVVVGISFPLLIDIMTEGYEIVGTIKVTKGIPKDSVYIGTFTEPNTQTAYLIFYHPTFDIVPAGNKIPELPVQHSSFTA